MSTIVKVVVSLVVVVGGLCEGGLELIKRCGDHGEVCRREEYCSDGTCLPCQRICVEENHNYDVTTCQQSCQDYIHDSVRHYLTAADSKELQETLEWLRGLVAVSITISCLVALALVALLGFFWLTQRRKATVKQRKDLTAVSEPEDGFSPPKHRVSSSRRQQISSYRKVICNNNDGGSEGKEKSGGGPRGGIGGGTVAGSVVTATTPLSTRHPSEDATLEGFAAYDNPGLAPSPHPVPRHETTF